MMTTALDVMTEGADCAPTVETLADAARKMRVRFTQEGGDSRPDLFLPFGHDPE
jgi:hypothetical protein